ncbi:MAG: aldehyde ferredoxin oxidoreductase family protein, partial [Acetobacteraceae bacterium]|nr:aldehyde ferredoxin oxidoreductase family protein [Acetobacteraceae bacterium]
PESLAREFLGGRGFVAKLLYDEVPPGTDPLSPENRVVMASGPLSGAFVPSSGKFSFGAKSPLTGGYGDSNVGGHLAPELKYAGYDAVVLEGAAPRPVVLVIDDGKVELRDGSAYWGKGSMDAEARLKADLGPDFQIAVIGPAGERLVRFACISHDFGRQAGRTGVGAVLGSKRLKAVCIRGTGTIPVADPRAAFEKGKEMYRAAFAKPGFKEWTPYGTAGVTDWVNEVGAFPTKNFQTGYFEPYREINGQTLRSTILVRDKGCFGCPIPCGKYSRARAAGREFYVEGPEYESIALLGGNLMLGDIREIAYANYVCDQLGLDSISAGVVVGFALECFETGLLSEGDIGRKVAFGDLDSVVYLLEKIAAREGIGELLSEGVKRAAARIGRGADRIAPQVKGMEWSGYESRWAPAMMLAYMTADIGAHHNRAWAITYDAAVGRDKIEGKAQKVIELQHIRPLFDMLGLCRLLWVEIGFELERYAEVFPLVTGLDYTWGDLLRASERVYNLTRAFNFRHIPGFGRAWDYPPARFYEEPVPTGPAKGRYIPREKLDELLDDYYRLRGWDRDGRPTLSKLEELGLRSVARDIGAV